MTPRRGWRDPSAFSVQRFYLMKTSLSFLYSLSLHDALPIFPSLRGIYLLWGTSVLKSNYELSPSQCAFITVIQSSCDVQPSPPKEFRMLRAITNHHHCK